MKIKNRLSLQRLVGKIDNDFNISESDWIPRVAAWTIDALSQLNVLPKERKRRTLEVSDRIAQFPCKIDATDLKVFTKNGCEIINVESSNDSCGCNSTSIASQEIAIMDDTNKTGVDFMKVEKVVQPFNRNYVLNGDQILLNFDTDEIEVETYETATYFDEYYQCYVPYIYDDGLLLEALAWYCLFKYLSRGSKHPVYNLESRIQVTNPFLQWEAIKHKAANSVKKALRVDDSGWNNFFYNSTFLPRT